MYYYSTRDKNREHRLTASEAILKGLAPDGGLYVPSRFPQLDCSLSLDLPYGQFASKVLAPFFKDDELEDSLEAICTKAFDFPVVLNSLKDKTVLELFHGPTCAFKDFGARFLSFSMEELLRKKGRKLCILVATSGDTGGAVASAFYRRDNLSVKVLFPKGRVAQGVTMLRVLRLTEASMTARKWSRAPLSTSGTWTVFRPRTQSTSAACCLRWSITSMPRCFIRKRRERSLSSSFRPAMWVTAPEPTGP